MGYEEAMDWMKDDADRREDEAEELATLRRELTEARRDGERLSHIIEQSNKGRGWLTDAVWDDAAELCPMVWEEAEDVQKWVRAVIDKDIAARGAK